MSSQRLIDAIFDLRAAITNERHRLNRLASAAEDMGFENLADHLVRGIEGLEVKVNEVVDAHGDAQSEELRGHQELMGNILVGLLDKASKSVEA